MKAYIIYNRYYDFHTKEVTVGGIQTYITDLISVLVDMGIGATVLQCGDSEENENMGSYTVRQLVAATPQDLAKAASNGIIQKEDDIVIYATDSIISKQVRFKNAIAIQHGISWDMPGTGEASRLHKLLSWLPDAFFQKRNLRNRLKDAYNVTSRLSFVKKVVCVDYNFVNWYRTLIIENRTNLHVIPNYTRICDSLNKPTDVINIIFARRFYWYRGTRVFATAIKRILDEYDNVHVTVAGSGPDESLLREQLGVYKNVSFISYKSDESMTIHADKHIAVVPTVGSEGTSLSLLEAMSAQCAVVCTNVGGMTNIVLDGYNGLMVPAGDDVKLYEAIKYLIDNKNECQSIADKGYETVRQCFSIEKWRNSWKTVLKEVVDGK